MVKALQGFGLFILLGVGHSAAESSKPCEAQSARPIREAAFTGAFRDHYASEYSFSPILSATLAKLREPDQDFRGLDEEDVMTLLLFSYPAYHSETPSLALFEESLGHINALLAAAPKLRPAIINKIQVTLPLIWEHSKTWMPLVDQHHLEELIEASSSFILSPEFVGAPDLRSFYLKSYIDLLPTLQGILGDSNETLGRLSRIIPLTRAAPRLINAQWPHLPEAWKKSLREHWLSKKQASPQKWPRLARLHSAAESEVGEMCGVCPTMDKGHWDSAMDVCGGLHSLNDTNLRGHHAGQRIVIGDQVVGLFKRTGDPSFLAVNGFSDSNGKPILVPGMIYTVSSELISTITSWSGSSEFRYPLSVYLPENTELAVSPMIAFQPTHCTEASGKCFIDFMTKLSDCIALAP